MIIFEFYIGRGIVASVIKYVVAYHSEKHPRGGGGGGRFPGFALAMFSPKMKNTVL